MEKLITSVHTRPQYVDPSVDAQIAQISLSQGLAALCQRGVEISYALTARWERGRERPKVRTVRELTAAAGDGLVGSARSPGRLETSLTLASSWASCDSYSQEAHTFVAQE